jgi:hypothetical protein
MGVMLNQHTHVLDAVLVLDLRVFKARVSGPWSHAISDGVYIFSLAHHIHCYFLWISLRTWGPENISTWVHRVKQQCIYLN